MVSANRVAAINPPIDDTGPIRNFSIDPESHTDWQNPAEFSPNGRPIRNFSIDPTSSIRTSIADAIFADAISETPMTLPKKVSYPLDTFIYALSEISVRHPMLQHIVRYLRDIPHQTSTEELRETIATSVVQYMKSEKD